MPSRKRAAACFTFDLDAEEVWIGEDPSNASKPGVLSQGTYGARVAVPLILELLDRHGVRATFSIPGRVAERYPDRVDEIVRAGHEIAHQGCMNTSPTDLPREQEEAELVTDLRSCAHSERRSRATARLPGTSVSTPRNCWKRTALRYSSNFMDDLRPYRQTGFFTHGDPRSLDLDDVAHFWFDTSTWTKKISTVEEVRAIWEGEFRGYHRLGGAWVLTMHPQVIGRPHRLALLDAMLSFVIRHFDVWIATCGELAGRVRWA